MLFRFLEDWAYLSPCIWFHQTSTVPSKRPRKEVLATSKYGCLEPKESFYLRSSNMELFWLGKSMGQKMKQLLAKWTIMENGKLQKSQKMKLLTILILCLFLHHYYSFSASIFLIGFGSFYSNKRLFPKGAHELQL